MARLARAMYFPYIHFLRVAYVVDMPASGERVEDVEEAAERLFEYDNTGLAAQHGVPSMSPPSSTMVGREPYIDVVILDVDGRRFVAVPLGYGWLVVDLASGRVVTSGAPDMDYVMPHLSELSELARTVELKAGAESERRVQHA